MEKVGRGNRKDEGGNRKDGEIGQITGNGKDEGK